MARSVIRTTLAVAILLALFYLVSWLGVRRYADSVVAGVGPAANISYAGISAWPLGQPGATGVRFIVANQPALAVTAERVQLGSGDLVWLGRWLLRLNPPWPDRLTLRLEGVSLSPGLLAALRIQAGAAGLILPFEGVGCGPEDLLSGDDYQTLGWLQPRFDIELQLRSDPLQRRVFARLRIDRMPAGAAVVELEFADVPERGVDVRADLGGARLDRLQLRLEELGGLARRNEHCARQAGVDADTFLTRHRERLHQRLRDLGIVPDEPIWSAYGAWLSQGGEWQIQARPAPSIPFTEYGVFAPEDRLRLLGLTARLGAVEAVPVEAISARRADSGFQPLPEDGLWMPPESETLAGDPWNEIDVAPEDDLGGEFEGMEPADPADSPEPDAQPLRSTARPFRRIAFADLESHLGQQVRVQTISGDRHRGRILGATADAIELEIARYGGGARLPIAREQIVAIDVLVGIGTESP